MWAICKKEFRQYFSNLTGYITIILFLLLNGLFLFVFSSFNILDFGYASLDNFFTLAPFVLLLLIPAVTMRLLPDEWKSGTMELLQTKPLTASQIVNGKYAAALLVVLMALIPTFVYVFSISSLAEEGTMPDTGGLTGSYIGLLFLSAGFTSISICTGSFTSNSVVAFLLSAFFCFALYSGFDALSSLKVFESGADYYLQQPGMSSHYRSLSRGVIDVRDVIYFLSLIFFFLFLTIQRVKKKK
ncbi:MAG: ABC transporter permease subunit [Chitinophagaceae bacterium]|nr:ABC transporter permease subunit [Chitinophagaceae bacterium]